MKKNPFISKLETKIATLKKLNQNFEKTVIDILYDIRHILIDMNVEDQLFIRGITSDGVAIIDSKPYSPFTVGIKKQKGQPTNRVTTRDTGEFHDGFTVKRKPKSIELTSTDDKTFELTLKYGDGLFGLTKENLEELKKEYVFPKLVTLIKSA